MAESNSADAEPGIDFSKNSEFSDLISAFQFCQVTSRRRRVKI
jgi:hypothetical protein